MSQICVQPTHSFVEFSKTEIEQSIPQRFEKQVNQYPNRIAVKTRESQLTYKQLNQAANRLAREIIAQRGKGSEAIALLFEQSANLVVSILGILKAGKFYVPLDPFYPQERNIKILEDSQAVFIVTNTENLPLAQELANQERQYLNVEQIDSHISSENLELSITPDTIAYILYTSGSTGQPKGVFQIHRNVLHHIMKYTNSLKISTDDRLLLLVSCSFTASISDIFGALLNGAVVVPFNLKKDGLNKLANWMIEMEITICNCVPTIFRYFVGLLDSHNFPKLRLIQIGGEPVTKKDVDLYKKHFDQNCILCVGFGATEINLARHYFINKQTILEENTVPVGYGVDDTEILLLNNDGNTVAIGEVGEIVVKSKYLCQGYWRRPDLTQAAFISNSQDRRERLYKTGDLGYFLPDGCLVHLGRKDFQVKIRGHRIEVAEVEMALLDIAGVKEAVVIAREDQNSDQILVVYLILDKQQKPDLSNLRNILKNKLPEFMIPAAFVVTESFPLTATNKIDRQALPTPNAKDICFKATFISPDTPEEKMLAEIWKKVLGLERIGVDDSFFELGGHSLLAVRLITDIEQHFGKNLSLATLFQASTIKQQALLLSQPTYSQSWSPLVAIQPQEGCRPPLFFVPGVGGSPICFLELARRLGNKQPFYGLQARGLDGDLSPLTTVEEVASEYVNAIKTLQLQGPYLLGGHSFGAIVAFEIAQQLQRQGQSVALLALLDIKAPIPKSKNYSQKLHWNELQWLIETATHLERLLGKKLEIYEKALQSLAPEAQLNYLKQELERVNLLSPDSKIARVRGIVQTVKAQELALLHYVPQEVHQGSIKLFRTHETEYNQLGKLKDMPKEDTWGWKQLSTETVDVYPVPGNHYTMLNEPYVQVLANKLKVCLSN
ncbi:MAG: amino acid adenylation domain-containing protein [Scytonema sp. PMC 1069.18]|nr:amino acid adenylation domain-containing protein [Scytonema sp. PMC 1069.18]MEC4879904.1 amino acid adenylation domain-containing protein [Scytonema sp. PMC 1070.18]